MKILRLLSGLLFAVLFVSGCKTTRYVPVTEVHYKDSVVTHWKHDSVFRHDSVFVNVYAKGDTVYKDRSVVRYEYKYLAMRDTVEVERRDSVPVIVEKKVTEYKCRIRWYHEAAVWFSVVVIGAVVLWLAKKVKR